MFIYAEFEIIHMFLKERRSKYKPAYAVIPAPLQVNAPQLVSSLATATAAPEAVWRFYCQRSVDVTMLVL